MITLTQNWQIIDTYRFEPGTGFIAEFYIEGKYSTQSLENNTTTTQFRLRSKTIVGSGSGNNYNFRLDYANAVSGSGLWTVKNEVIVSSEATITHNEDGTKTTGVTADIFVEGLGLNASLQGGVILPTISRYAIITDAPNFNDEENPTITFTNTGLYNVRPVLYAIYNDERVIISTGQTLQNGETSYTFDLDEYAFQSQTQTQRDKLRELCTGQSIIIIYAVQTSVSPTPYISTARATMNIVNATPTFTYTITETNANVISVLGGSSASSIIQNASVVDITFTPVVLKYATISAVSVVYNGLTYTVTTSPYTLSIPIVNSNIFTLSVIDSRGYVTSQVDSNRTLIDYEAVKVNNFSFVRYAPTSSDIIFNGEFLYYSSFGNISNTPVVKWKLDDGSYNTIPSSNYSIDTTNHKLTITNYRLSNALVYTSVGQFTIYIEDKLTSNFVTSENGKVGRGIPTFDAGEYDLKINGKLYLADQDGQNPVEIKQGNIERVLYNDTNGGTNGNVTLSDSASNYDYMEIYFRSNDGVDHTASQKIYSPDGKKTYLIFWYLFDTTSDHSNYVKTKKISINGTTISVLNHTEVFIGGSTSSNGNNMIWITRVVGIKEVV